MKKLSISLLIVLGLLTAGCNDKEKQQVKELQNETAKLEQQLEEKETPEAENLPADKETPEAEKLPADKNKKAKAVELGQCYDCGKEKDISKMKYEGISDRYHCGCKPEYKNIKNDNPKDFMETCLICKEKMHSKYGKIAEDGWACYTCIDRVNAGEIVECMGCAKFYDPSKIKYDANDNGYCNKCYDKYAEVWHCPICGSTYCPKDSECLNADHGEEAELIPCEECGSTNNVSLYQLTIEKHGINAFIYSCPNCWKANN